MEIYDHEKGYVRVVPYMSKVGDVVAVVKGGRVPFVLQTSRARAASYRLGGECYVHGIMNGEGISLQRVVEKELRLH